MGSSISDLDQVDFRAKLFVFSRELRRTPNSDYDSDAVVVGVGVFENFLGVNRSYWFWLSIIALQVYTNEKFYFFDCYVHTSIHIRRNHLANPGRRLRNIYLVVQDCIFERKRTYLIALVLFTWLNITLVFVREYGRLQPDTHFLIVILGRSSANRKGQNGRIYIFPTVFSP